MPKKDPIPVVVDSNIVYAAGPTMVSPQFEQTWKECLEFKSLRLYVPEVVKGERIYQLARIANEAAQNAKKNFDNIHASSGLPKPAIPEFEELKKNVEQHFNEWLRAHNAVTVPIPFDKIDWKRMANDAIWRIAPFTPTEKDKAEKGFRDALVLESLCSVHGGESGVIFICHDGALCEATKARLGKKVALYSDMASFISSLKLEKETHAKAVADAIYESAKQEFFKDGDVNCIYYKFKIFERIFKEFSIILEILFQPRPPSFGAQAMSGGIMSGMTPTDVYKPVSEEKVLIDSTVYREAEKLRYSWTTQLRFVRLFAKSVSFPISEENYVWFQLVRMQSFSVLWSAEINPGKVKDKIAWDNIAIDKIFLGEKSVEPAFVAKEKYGFVGPWYTPLQGDSVKTKAEGE